jgi:hypothetical protein
LMSIPLAQHYIPCGERPGEGSSQRWGAFDSGLVIGSVPAAVFGTII